jgi:hypothetical protein
MNGKLDLRILVNEVGFTFQHSVFSRPMFNKLFDSQRFDQVKCTHVFQDNTYLEPLAELVENAARESTSDEDVLRKIHELIFPEANRHIFERDEFFWTRGNERKLTIDDKTVSFVQKEWDDGNEYQGISPTSYTYTWSIPRTIFELFLAEMQVENREQLVHRFDGADYYEALQKLRRFSEANNTYIRKEH